MHVIQWALSGGGWPPPRKAIIVDHGSFVDFVLVGPLAAKSAEPLSARQLWLPSPARSMTSTVKFQPYCKFDDLQHDRQDHLRVPQDLFEKIFHERLSDLLPKATFGR